MSINRRDVLARTCLTTLAMAGLAGCADLLDDDEASDTETTDSESVNAGENEPGVDDRTVYSNWLAVDEHGNTGFVYVTWKTIEQLGGIMNENLRELQGADDPMIAPAAGGFTYWLMANNYFSFTGLDGIVMPSIENSPSMNDENGSDGRDELPKADDFDSEVEVVLWINGLYVLLGDFDLNEINGKLTDPPAREMGEAIRYERTDEIGDFDVYETSTSEDQIFSPIAVRDDAIAYGPDVSTDAFRHTIETAQGEHETIAQKYDEFTWLLETAGEGDFVSGSYGETEQEPDEALADEGNDAEENSELDDTDGIRRANAFISSMTVNESEGAAGDFAAVFDELNDEIESSIENELGSSADEVDIEFDDDRVTATASWNEDITDFDG